MLLCLERHFGCNFFVFSLSLCLALSCSARISKHSIGESIHSFSANEIKAYKKWTLVVEIGCISTVHTMSKKKVEKARAESFHYVNELEAHFFLAICSNIHTQASQKANFWHYVCCYDFKLKCLLGTNHWFNANFIAAFFMSKLCWVRESEQKLTQTNE